MWPEPAGELGALELGELLCDEVPPGEIKHPAKNIFTGKYIRGQITINSKTIN